ncbi:MAG TPA: diguanylate cyclase [Anaerolineales bacterium]|nr:diguanylate cyclase [Anaerolineales bacterium]
MKNEKPQIDSLTGLLTRRAFEERFKVSVQNAVKRQVPLSLAYIDIDQFLNVNEAFGHLGGDAVLAGIATLLKQHLGPEAILGRYGGDELVVLLPDAEREQAFLAIERLRAAVESKIDYRYEEAHFSIQVTISAGIASFPIDGQNEVELLRKADQALYRAKEVSRNTIRLAYDERMVPKTTHYTMTQLERLSKLAQEQGCTEAELLREALDDLLKKYGVTEFVR